MMDWFEHYIGLPGLVYMALPLVFLAMGYAIKHDAERRAHQRVETRRRS